MEDSNGQGTSIQGLEGPVQEEAGLLRQAAPVPPQSSREIGAVSAVELGERVTLSTLYEALMKERDRVDEALGEFRTEISGFRSEQREMARQIGQIQP